MRGPNLSSWALEHRSVMRFLIALAAIVGVYSYMSLGRQEDPDFTIKNMLVSAAWPGASAKEMADQAAEPIERAILSLPEVDYMKTNVQPGRMVINIKLRESVAGSDVPAVWTKVRQRVSDVANQLPSGLQGPQFNDDFGDTYGNIYALTGSGYTLPQLNDFAEKLRDRFRQLPDIGRIELEGAPEERIYVEYSVAKIATLGIDPRTIVAAIRDTNTVSSAGVVDAGAERVRINVTGTFDSVDAIRKIGIASNGQSLRLGDLAKVRRTPADPPTFRMRFNGQDAVGVMVSLRKGGNITRLGKDSDALIDAFKSELPLGVDLGTVSNQPEVVKRSIGEFTKSLFEAVAIVLAVSLVSLGWRPGLVVALSIPVVLALTFTAMLAIGIPLHRVSLGALIIALGLLVDDAIIVVEQIDAHLHEGWERTKAVVSAYVVTAQPMLIGTIITMLGFLPIEMAPSSAGEYSRAIFQVVAISLGFSWIVAVLVTPFIANRILPEQGLSTAGNDEQTGHGHESYDSPFYQRFRDIVSWALDHRALVLLVTVAMFVLALGLFALAVPKQFFPTSDRSELIVDLRPSQNTSFAQTMEVSQRMERLLAANKDINSITTYVGGGTPRFYLSFDIQTPSLALAQLVIQTKGEEERERVQSVVEDLLANRFPEVRGRVSPLELGPPVGQPFKIRLTGTDFADIAPAAGRLETLMHAESQLRDINKDYGDFLKTVRVEVDQDKARALGITSLVINNALEGALEGAPMTRYRDGDKALDVIARSEEATRKRLDRLSQINIPTASGRTVPLTQVARLLPSFEQAELNRRSSMPTITLQADVAGAQPVDVAQKMAGDLDKIRASLPSNASLTLGGTIEESAASQSSVLSQLPVAMILILFLLVLQLQSIKKMWLVLITGPLALIGVALILSIFRIPFGFVAMLGGLALFGMVIRNSVILVSQIDALEAAGADLRDAIVEAAVHRVRPIMLTALAAILAMIPLTRSIFWGPMAWSIMGGLMVATLLTLIFLPAVYAAAYGAKGPKIETENAHA